MIRSGARAAMQPRDAVVVDVEVLADQLAQQPVRLADRLVVKQPVGPLDGPQRALGVLGDPVSIRSRSAFSRQRQSGLSPGRA